MFGKFDVTMLLPPTLNNYSGPRIIVWFLFTYNMIGTTRSLLHIFLPDSGAQTIATMNLNVAGRQNIVSLLGQWGGAQIIMATIIWLVLWRYRIFIPLMIAEVAIEQLIRILIGLSKPVVSTSPPPGGLGSKILLPIATIMFFASLLKTDA